LKLIFKRNLITAGGREHVVLGWAAMVLVWMWLSEVTTPSMVVVLVTAEQAKGSVMAAIAAKREKATRAAETDKLAWSTEAMEAWMAEAMEAWMREEICICRSSRQICPSIALPHKASTKLFQSSSLAVNPPALAGMVPCVVGVAVVAVVVGVLGREAVAVFGRL
jgi:hypothetical protein